MVRADPKTVSLAPRAASGVAGVRLADTLHSGATPGERSSGEKKRRSFGIGGADDIHE
jgi:hypothetical protein